MQTKENLVSLSISAADLKEIQVAIETLKIKLLPHLLALTIDEKMHLAKMKDKTIAFVTKAYEHGMQNPKLVPNYVDFTELKKDLDAVELLRQLLYPLEEIAQNTEDTMTVAGSEAYTAALAFYDSVKVAAKAGVPGAMTIVNDLKVRFDYRRGKGTDTPPPTE